MRPLRVVRALVIACCLAPAAFAGVSLVRRHAPNVIPPPKPECELANEAFVPLDTEKKSSAVVVAKLDRKRIAFVADTDEHEIVAIDTRNGRVLAREGVGGAPSSLLLDETGKLYVTARDANVVRVFAPNAERVACGTGGPLLRSIAELPTASEPVALAETPDGESLLVATGWGHTLEAFSKKDETRLFTVALPREPRAVVVDAKGRRAFVSHAMGPLSIVDLHGRHDVRQVAIGSQDTFPSETRIVATPTNNIGAMREGFGVDTPSFGIGLNGDGGLGVDSQAKLPQLSKATRLPTQGFALASFDGRVLAPEVLVQPGKMPEPTKLDPAPRPTGYGSFGGSSFVAMLGPATAHVAVVEMGSETVLSESTRLTVDDRTCLLPRAAAIDPQRRTLVVACIGSNEINEYDARAASPTSALRGRWTVPAGPTGLAVFDEKIAVWSSFDRVLTVVGRDNDHVYASTTRERKPTPFEVGRKIFHATTNPAISSDGRACASCHPDGRDDGVTWVSPDGPRQTPMLAGRLAETAPFGWTGAAATVREHLTQTLRRLEGRGLNDEATYALLTYLSQMPTPQRSAVRDAKALARGQKIFNSYEAGCSSCHTVRDGKAVGDGDTHDVGSKARGDVETALQTPSLQFVGGTGPYFHDGRYATLDDLFRGTDGKMGRTAHLTKDDRAALVTYLESL